MDEQDVLDAPMKIMLFTWLNNLMQNGNASYNEENTNIIDLDSYSSSWFCVGRDNDTLDGFIGVPKNLIPWFIDLKFKHAVISHSKRRLYLSCGNEDEVGFTISIKIRSKRMSLIWNKNNDESDVKNLDLRMFSIKADNSISLSEKVLHVVPLIQSDDLDKVVFQDNIKEPSREEMFADEIKQKFKEEYASKYMDLNNGDDIEDEW